MSNETVPVIDVRDLGCPNVLQELDGACREWGFFQALNHGVDTRVLENLKQAMRAFFAQPSEAKQRVLRSADNPWGFYDHELTKNSPDWKEIFDYGPADSSGAGFSPELMPRWPDGLPSFEPAVLAYYEACEALSLRVLDAIGRNLGTPGSALTAGFHPRHSSFLRLNYYPVCPTPARPTGLGTPEEGYLSVNHHTDSGAVTVLLQSDEPGLEIFHSDAWHGVQPRPDALVVNIGDIVQVWSNDRYPAAVHRVTASAERARFSAPFFLNPAYDFTYAPLPGTVDAGHPPRYRAINWGEFRRQRAAGDYADIGEEIQIAHYAING